MPSPPPDYPCLFPVGFHTLSLADVEQVCVDLFPLSVRRSTIMDGLKAFVQRLTVDGVTGELWIDGSFLTEKIDPKDVDVLLRYDGTLYNMSGPVVRAAVDWVIANQKESLGCDSYVLMEYPEDHPLHTEGEWWYSYWHRQWGFTREVEPKGIVVIELSSGPP